MPRKKSVPNKNMVARHQARVMTPMQAARLRDGRTESRPEDYTVMSSADARETRRRMNELMFQRELAAIERGE